MDGVIRWICACEKAYDRSVLAVSERELIHIKRLLKQYEEEQLEAVYDKLSEDRQDLVSPVFPTDEQFISEWEGQKFEPKGFPEDAPEYYTAKGERVRSKSEIILADALARKDIPYQYERPLRLKGYGTIHPDFTVLNVRGRKTYYWEHLGMMDDPEYSQKAIERISQYQKNGIYPGEHLILTYETRNYPLQTRQIDDLITHYLV